MRKEEFKKVLIEAVRETTKNVLESNQNSVGSTPQEDEYEYEATYKALLYHHLLMRGIDYKYLNFEWRPDKEELTLKHIDLWFDGPNKRYSFLIEVKQVYRLNRKRDDISIQEYRTLRDGTLVGGIVYDVIKLTNSCKNDKRKYGIMLMTFVDSRMEDTVKMNNIKKSIRNIGLEHNLKINTDRIQLLWSSGKRTEYLSIH